MSTRILRTRILLALLASTLALATACSEDEPLAPPAPADKGADTIRQTGDLPPAEQAVVMVDGTPVVFWPYTGTSFDGTPVDPINLVFVGAADPLRIRAALMGLDGDRTAFGIPPVAPFDAVWQDAIGGDVQTACAVTGDGWTGSVIQLTLGEYGPLRVHVRLFGTGQTIDGRAVTLGGAHFELQIPGTTEHAVLSWELAEQIVMADMMRTGLLDPAAPLQATGPINAAPGYRTIDPMIYNMLPAELTSLIGGPPAPVAQPVPLPSDGQGTLFNVAVAAPVAAGVWTSSLTVVYDQMVPRPFCADGPGDWLLVSGPVDFKLRVQVAGDGTYSALSSYSGVIEALPVDFSGGAPVPVGDPFNARVSGRTNGHINGVGGRIEAADRRFTKEADGTQLVQEWLNLPQTGQKTYRAMLRCIDDE